MVRQHVQRQWQHVLRVFVQQGAAAALGRICRCKNPSCPPVHGSIRGEGNSVHAKLGAAYKDQHVEVALAKELPSAWIVWKIATPAILYKLPKEVQGGRPIFAHGVCARHDQQRCILCRPRSLLRLPGSKDAELTST